MSSKTRTITGWTLTVLISLIFVMSAFMKITQNETAVSQAASLGFSASTYLVIGIIEIVSLVLFIVPRTGVLGSLLLIAYLGGAIVTHLQHNESIVMAVTIQILLWIAAVIRFPELKERLLTAKVPVS